MGWIVARFASLGLGESLARLAAWVATLLATAALLGVLLALWIHRHDRQVIDAHEAPIAAAIAAATGSAEAVADANDRIRASDRAQADQQLRDAIDDASSKDPDGVRRPAGPAVRAVVDGLRRQ